ncbi:putative bifunctional diguanylate cyclase/phosphodiesterase [Salibacterium lacus]|uniref:Bifunctional diguanylate cyclase/phosphodiesterase n=1 Tax=Salibacterium lacus TaxID=1898109 RepID=A0ABW5T3A9_9BACI
MDRAQSRLQAIWERSGYAVYEMDLHGFYLDANKKMEEITGYARHEFEELSFHAVVLVDEINKTKHHFRLAARGETQHYEVDIVKKDGTPATLHVSNFPLIENDRVVRVIGMAIDITGKKQETARMHRMAFYDTITNLPNEVLFLDRLEQTIQQSRHEERKLHVLCLHIDQLSEQAETLGTPDEHELFQAVINRLMKHLRPEDSMARGAKDQFFCLLPAVLEAGEMEYTAEDILSIFDHSFLVSGTSVRLKGRLGIAVFDGTEGTTAGELLEQARTAAQTCEFGYEKAWQYYETKMEETRYWKRKLGYHITTGLTKNEFYLEYQPIVDAASGRPLLMEALIRWEHPTLGTISPGRFIPLAEELGSIVALGRWVLMESCRMAASWKEAGHQNLIVSVNVSVKQLLEGKAFVQTVKEILEETALPPSLLELEITETVLMSKEGDIKKTLEQLEKLGVRLAIDDFGTGYSSLTHLNTFPVHTLKIDKSFIHNLSHQENNKAIVSSLVTLAGQLDLCSIAEGVETAEEAAVLKEKQCQGLQGYYFSRPLPAFEVPAYLQRMNPGTTFP